MKDETWLYDLLAERENDPDFLAEGLVLEVTEQISARMRELELRPTDLARRLGVSRAFVSQLLNGRPNMTLRTLVCVAHALDQRVSLKLHPKKPARMSVASFDRAFRPIPPESTDAIPVAA